MTEPAPDSSSWRRYAPELREYVAGRAGATDRGETDLRDTLRYFGERGLLGVDVSTGRTGIVDVAGLISLVAGECLSSAFSLWAHRMVLEYLREAERNSVLGRLRAELEAGARVGSTAMAAALQEAAGLRTVPVVATPDGDGFRLDGPIRWASNLVPGAAVVLPARVSDTNARIVAVVHTDGPGVSVAPPARLLALDSTVSSSVTLTGARVDREYVVTEDLSAFVRRTRPVLLLLQTAFCLGLAARSVEEARVGVTGPGAVLAPEVDELAARLAEAADRAREAQRAPASADPRAVTQLRFDAAAVTLAAARLEATVRGGLGYVVSSPTNRRLREAAFLPAQSPSEIQLRWELSRAGGQPALDAVG